jgi:hypothetical protein
MVDDFLKNHIFMNSLEISIKNKVEWLQLNTEICPYHND